VTVLRNSDNTWPQEVLPDSQSGLFGTLRGTTFGGLCLHQAMPARRAEFGHGINDRLPTIRTLLNEFRPAEYAVCVLVGKPDKVATRWTELVAFFFYSCFL